MAALQRVRDAERAYMDAQYAQNGIVPRGWGRAESGPLPAGANSRYPWETVEADVPPTQQIHIPFFSNQEFQIGRAHPNPLLDSRSIKPGPSAKQKGRK
jgi:hypothetical protein